MEGKPDWLPGFPVQIYCNRSAFGMVKMAALAPKGVFEEEDFYVPAWEEPPYERHFDDYTRNCDGAA